MGRNVSLTVSLRLVDDEGVLVAWPTAQRHGTTRYGEVAQENGPLS